MEIGTGDDLTYGGGDYVNDGSEVSLTYEGGFKVKDSRRRKPTDVGIG